MRRARALALVAFASCGGHEAKAPAPAPDAAPADVALPPDLVLTALPPAGLTLTLHLDAAAPSGSLAETRAPTRTLRAPRLERLDGGAYRLSFRIDGCEGVPPAGPQTQPWGCYYRAGQAAPVHEVAGELRLRPRADAGRTRVDAVLTRDLSEPAATVTLVGATP